MLNRLDLQNRGIDSLAGLSALEEKNIALMNLRGNQLSNFHHFGTHPYLTVLDVSENRITSLFGLTKQPNLEIVQLRGNPVAQHPLYRIMVLLSVGFSVRSIDGIDVSRGERKTARELGAQAALAVACGWLLDLRPRSDQAYLDEAKKAKRECSRQMRARPSQCTVTEALTSLSRAADTGKPRAPPSATILERLCMRVKDLEHHISQLEMEKKALEVRQNADQHRGANSTALLNRPTAVSAAAAAQMPALDVATTSCVEFNQGIRATVIGVYVHARSSQACLRITDSTLYVLTFFQRTVIAELAMNSAMRVEFNYPLTLCIHDTADVAVHLEFSTLLGLYSVYHCLSVKAFGGMRPFPLTDEQYATLEREAAERIDKLASSHEGSGSCGAAGSHSAPSEDQPPRTARSAGMNTSTSGSPEDNEVEASGNDAADEKGAHAVADAKVEIDRAEPLGFVADVPPLPKSPGYMGSSVRAADTEARETSLSAPPVGSPPVSAGRQPAVSRFQNLLVDSTDSSTVRSVLHSRKNADPDQIEATAPAPVESTTPPPNLPSARSTSRSKTSLPTLSVASAPAQPAALQLADPSTAAAQRSPSEASGPGNTSANPTPAPTSVPAVTTRRFQAFMIDSDSDSDA